MIKNHQHADQIAKVCRLIEASQSELSLDELAEIANLSPFHFHKVFKEVTGVTPKAYYSAVKAKRFKQELNSQSSITDAIYKAGFGSNSRLYEKSEQLLGMTPKKYRSGAKDERIKFALGECNLGHILVAATDKGVCAISLGDDPESLLNEFQDAFPNAELIGADEAFEKKVALVVGFVEDPRLKFPLPLDIRGTAFQQAVWQVLQTIPFGKTYTYTEIAEKLGRPKSVRAVANACGANALAIAIPCHRVIRSDGSLSGYRWGLDRKRKLIDLEASVGSS